MVHFCGALHCLYSVLIFQYCCVSMHDVGNHGIGKHVAWCQENIRILRFVRVVNLESVLINLAHIHYQTI